MRESGDIATADLFAVEGASCIDSHRAVPDVPAVQASSGAGSSGTAPEAPAVPDVRARRRLSADECVRRARTRKATAEAKKKSNLATIKAIQDQRDADNAAAGVTLTPADADQGVAEVSEAQANESAPLAETPAATPEVSGVADSPIPGLDQRPCWRAFDDWLEVEGRKRRPGVYHFGVKERNDGPSLLTEQWVCTPLYVDAVVADTGDGNFGRLLRFRNTHGRWRTWAMPMRMLAGRGDELRGVLLDCGVEIDPRGRDLLSTYLQAQHPARRMTCATQTGWHGDSFVLPDGVIGPGASDAVFQSEESGSAEYTTAGSLRAWRERIAGPALGNPILTLALSVAFAGPLLGKLHAEGGGVHLVGDSSTGKTTCADAARSVWGGPEYRRSWRATANGIEAAAALFNDSVLVLDEISECDPREIGLIVYSLTNGTGKQRASRTGAARSIRRWRCTIVSTGEKTVATSMLEGGQRAKAGQAVRLLDVPVNRRHGAWDNLHGHVDGRALSDALKAAAAEHYGEAGREFLERLTQDKRDFGAMLESIKALPEFAAADAQGQAKRAASRFALFALAGELATEYDLTGWPEGQAIEGMSQAFALWREQRGGGGNDERRKIIEQIVAFIDRHGDSRFQAVDAGDSGPVIRDRAGWYEDEGGERVYLFTAEGFAEAVRGFEKATAYDVLVEAGAAPAPGANGKRQRFQRIDGMGRKLYRVHASKLEA